MRIIVKKIITFIVTVLLVTLFVFIAFELIPGDAATARLGINATPEALMALREEMGLKALELEFFCVNSGPEAHYVYPNGDEVSNYEIVYLCRKYIGEPMNIDGEMEELRFFAPSEIDLDMISPPIRPVIHKYLGQYA